MTESAVWQAVEAALSERFGTPVEITGTQNFPHSQVFRCTLQASGAVAPSTVIVRLPRTETARAGSALLDSERAALEYLTARGSTLAPHYFAGSADSGFLASEDLGADPSLLDLLLGNDPKAATQGALAFAHSLATLHAQTLSGPANLPHVPLAIAEHWDQVQDAVKQLGLPAPQGVGQDIAEITRILGEPGNLLALSSGDPSVVNCKVTTNGSVRFFDFEEACLRHAFIDASVLRFLYPTGGPPWRLPAEIALAVEATYRTELARACPAASEEARYENGMAAASAAWMILRMARLPRVDAGPDRDPWLLLPPGWTRPVPTRSRRRQLLSILETGIASANRAQTLSALTAWAERIAEALRTRWPEAAEELPLYPAFESHRLA